MQRRVSIPVLALWFSGVGSLVAFSHILVSKLLDYASYWWMNKLTWPDADWTLNTLFLLLPLPSVLVGLLVVRRLGWFPQAAAGAVALHLIVRLLDEASGLALSSVAAPSAVYWLVPSVLYGIVAALGALLGVALKAKQRYGTEKALIMS